MNFRLAAFATIAADGIKLLRDRGYQMVIDAEDVNESDGYAFDER